MDEYVYEIFLNKKVLGLITRFWRNFLVKIHDI